MTNEQVEYLRIALAEFARATQAALEAMQPLIDEIKRLWFQVRRFVRLALRRFGLLPTPCHPMTRKKLRRAVLLGARVGPRGIVRMRGSNPPYLFDPLLN